MVEDSPRSFSLSELLGSVRRCLDHSFPQRYWVRAEVSDFRQAGQQGHAYLELLEKGARGEVVARVRGVIWAQAYAEIQRRFVRSGVGQLTSGMSILALVGISFHEQYGLSLQITDIDPSYSLGEIARLRLETIARLRKEGLYDMNKELPLPCPLQRLAIISSATAAGYGDFMRQLHDNSYGVQFYTALFTAQMQGEHTTESVIAALDRIDRHREHFDAVVIIRGGGAVSELRAFDEYRLCEVCAQYPLPIISGIGHERDESVLDLIAHTSLKTPTAVAAFLIDTQVELVAHLQEMQRRLPEILQRLSLGRGQYLQTLITRLQLAPREHLERELRRGERLQARLQIGARAYLQSTRHTLRLQMERIPSILRYRVQEMRHGLSRLASTLPLLLTHRLERENTQLGHWEQAIRLSHPDNILSRGFSIISSAGTILTSSSSVTTDMPLELRFHDGIVHATAESIQRAQQDKKSTSRGSSQPSRPVEDEREGAK